VDMGCAQVDKRNAHPDIVSAHLGKACERFANGCSSVCVFLQFSFLESDF